MNTCCHGIDEESCALCAPELIARLRALLKVWLDDSVYCYDIVYEESAMQSEGLRHLIKKTKETLHEL